MADLATVLLALLVCGHGPRPSRSRREISLRPPEKLAALVVGVAIWLGGRVAYLYYGRVGLLVVSVVGTVVGLTGLTLYAMWSRRAKGGR
jgi:hypothetical protein